MKPEDLPKLGSKKKAILCDLDGTIALIEHRRHFVEGEHQNWDKFFEACDQDLPNTPVIELLKVLTFYGFKVYITSGRMETVREKTVHWLKENGVPYEKLTMRDKGDNTPDHVLKLSWLGKDVPNKEEILFVLDDRDKVVKMWREEGISCLQVAPGNF